MTHTCADCGNTFAPARADAAYCSSACRQRAYRNRNANAVTALIDEAAAKYAERLEELGLFTVLVMEYWTAKDRGDHDVTLPLCALESVLDELTGGTR